MERNERMCSWFLRTVIERVPMCVGDEKDIKYKFDCEGCKLFSPIESRLRREAVRQEEERLGLWNQEEGEG